MRSLALALLVTGCSTGEATPSGPTDAHYAYADAASHAGTAKNHVLFVQTEGVELHPGPADATINQTPLVASTTALAPFADGAADRADRIAAVVGELRTILAPYDIELATVRPATGAYHQIVLTDTPISGDLAPISGDCDPPASAIALVYNTQATHGIVANAIATYGFLSKIPFTTTANDCMCYVQCSAPAAACEIHAQASVDTSAQDCVASPTIDEDALWRATFGAHP